MKPIFNEAEGKSEVLAVQQQPRESEPLTTTTTTSTTTTANTPTMEVVGPLQTSSSSSSRDNTTTAHSSSEYDEQMNGVSTKKEEGQAESRVGAFPSQLPRLRGIHKNREDALEALGVGGKRTPNHATDAVATSQHQEQQQQQQPKKPPPPPAQMANESPDDKQHKQQKSPTTKQKQQEQFDVMAIVRKRAMEANEVEEDESRVGAIPSLMPLLVDLPKNREDALESIGSGGKRTPNNSTTDAMAYCRQQQEQQKNPLALQRTNESLNNQSQQQKSTATEQQEQSDVMDIVLKRAIMANNEEIESNHQEALSMPKPPSDASVTFDRGQNHSDPGQAPSNATANVAQAGAFAGAPGEGLHRRDNIRFSHVGIHHPPLPADEESTNTNTNNNSNNDNTSLVVDGPEDYPSITPPSGDDALAKALPVEDDEQPMADMEAQPYDIEEVKQKKLEEAKRQRKHYLVLALAFACIVGGVIVGVVFHNQNKESRMTSLPTLAPSTIAPTYSPSSAPSGALDFLWESLPEQTREKICCNTPQYKAWDWLLKHPNITNFEEWKKKQLFALATFFYSFWGPDWNQLIRERWMDYEKEECQWFSSGYGYFHNGEYHELVRMTSCNDDGEITSLWLEDLQLSGFNPTIPPEIALLTSLTTIALAMNGIKMSLSDMLPDASELIQLKNLTEVDFFMNSLTGPLPSELGMMTSLKRLTLGHNALTGWLPSELGLMTSLLMLELNDNALSGQLLNELLLLTNLTLLSLDENALTGQLSRELGLLTSLAWLRLSKNTFTGQLPSELGLMTSLKSLELHGNTLTGQLPSELGLMTILTTLHLNDNDFTGIIPAELIALTSAFDVNLRGNNNFRLPTEIGLLTNTFRLDLSDHSLKGPLPSELGMMTSLKRLYLNDNASTGRLPSEVGLLTSLTWLYLNENALTGRLPSELGLMTSLRRLYINENALTGRLPSELGLMTKLTELKLHYNALTVSIPSQLALITNLLYFRLENNTLTGTIPLELESLVVNGSLEVLMLAKNSLLGKIPEHLCSLGALDTSLHEHRWRGLSFDCGDELCGCCWCPCPESNYSRS